MAFSSSLMESGVRTPETTSSPCAFIRYSPKNTCSPVAGLRVKAHAGAGVLAQVAEDHGLHVDRCADRVVDVVDAAIGLGALVLPAPENGVAGGEELIQRILREVLAVSFFTSFLYSAMIFCSASGCRS
jgi:hypothetical protein